MQAKFENPKVVTALMYDSESTKEFVQEKSMLFCKIHPRETVVALYQGLVISVSGAHGEENLLDAFQFLPQTLRRSC